MPRTWLEIRAEEDFATTPCGSPLDPLYYPLEDNWQECVRDDDPCEACLAWGSGTQEPCVFRRRAAR